MSEYIPDTHILCENCYKYFVSYIKIRDDIDTDYPGALARDAQSGMLNRVICPYCSAEYTYEIPLMLYSYKHNFMIASGFGSDGIKVASFETAAAISGLCSWRLRLTEFTMQASEKTRIFSSGMCDGKTELLKLQSFPVYKCMKLDDEYIVFDRTEDDSIIFSHRDFTDKIIEEYKVSKSEYSLIEDINIPRGVWITIDREWAKNYMEENKK